MAKENKTSVLKKIETIQSKVMYLHHVTGYDAGMCLQTIERELNNLYKRIERKEVKIVK